MQLPKIAIVGRPNVGKSALFNRLCGRRIAIVDEQEGITRDRNYCDGRHLDWHFTLIDTAGIHPQSAQELRREVLLQTQVAIEEADALIMVVDAQAGSTLLDQQVALQLLKRQKPLCLAVNKVDNESLESGAAAFYSLGITPLVSVSASHGYQIAELLESLLPRLPKVEPRGGNERIGVAFVGKPNVGKSTLVNALLEDDRCIVSSVPGTTRDALDCEFEFDNRPYTLIDTAGIRRKHREKHLVEKLAAMRAEKALERSQVALLLLDAETGIGMMEKRLARKIEEEGKGCVLFLNKWDLVRGVPMESTLRALHEEVPFLAHCPTLIGSALKGRNVEKLLKLVAGVFDSLQQRIATGPLNRFVEDVVAKHQPAAIDGKRLRIYYTAQVQALPPTFLLFVNQPRLLQSTWRRYLAQQLRKTFGFEGVPLRIYTRGKPRGA